MQALASSYDVAVIGSGFTGLAHAYWAAKRGLRVAVFERHASARGHSMRQPGLLRPLRESGPDLERAIRSCHTWLQLADIIGFYAERKGSLILAHSDLEMAVIEEFAASSSDLGYRVQCLTTEQTLARSPSVRTEELAGALYSATEVSIDPRQALRALSAYLQEEMRVDFLFRTPVTEIATPYVYNGRRRWRADHIVVCTGSDTGELFPELIPADSSRYCKSQYLRTHAQPIGWRLGLSILTGLSLPHLPSFGHCPSLPLLRNYLADRLPGYVRWGIDLQLSQTVLGEITIGDSREYISASSPFDRREINELLLRYLHRTMNLPDYRIQETWHSLQLAAPPAGEDIILQPKAGLTIINGLGDAELTTCFGVAQDLVIADFQLPGHRMTA